MCGLGWYAGEVSPGLSKVCRSAVVRAAMGGGVVISSRSFMAAALCVEMCTSRTECLKVIRRRVFIKIYWLLETKYIVVSRHEDQNFFCTGRQACWKESERVSERVSDRAGVRGGSIQKISHF